MKRKDAIEIVFATIDSRDVVVSTTGLISREIFEKFDSEQNIYVPGSMGLTSSIGLGIAMNLPNRNVVVVDGDASILMNLGSLVTIGHSQPKNLTHIVFDNSACGSCSEEISMSNSAHLDQLASCVGYKSVNTVSSQKALKCAMISPASGSKFILVKIELGGRRNFRRPLQLVEIRDRLMKFLNRPD